MPGPESLHGSGPDAAGKRKVMIYVRPALHRAVKMVALDDQCPASDVYASAVLAFLAARGIEIADEPTPDRPAGPPAATTSDLETLVDKLGCRLEAVLATAVAQALPPRDDGAAAPANKRTADAMAAILGLLREAGADGIASEELTRAMSKANITSGTAEQAKVHMRQAGLVRYEGRRWYIC